MRIERNSWSKPSSDPEYYESTGQTPSPVIGLGGFVLAVGLHGLMLWGLTEILHKQDIISWQFEPWQPYVISLMYFIVRSMNRVMYGNL